MYLCAKLYDIFTNCNMLINFTFGNFRSFKDEKTLNMNATSITEHKESLIKIKDYKIVPVTVMYGANSSGKSNVIKAFAFFKRMILNSTETKRDSKLDFDPFKLDEASLEKCTSFEIEFVADNTIYRYGFEYTENEIVGEWLFEKSGNKEICLFDIEFGEIEIDDKNFAEAKELVNNYLGNKLFLSLVYQNAKRPDKSAKIINWLENKLNIISGINPRGYESFTLKMLSEKNAGYQNAVKFFKKLDLGFSDYKIEELSISDIKKMIVEGSNDIKDLNKLFTQMSDNEVIVVTKTGHTVRLKTGQKEQRFFEEDNMESEGSKKIISLSGPIFDTLNDGGVIVVDELDAKLHPFLTREIVRLFTNKETNTHGAQLIFATHDTNLLDLSILRRDEIWFTEKNENEATDLYSLAEFKTGGDKVRKDASLEKNYINGRYGAIPYIN